MTIGVDEQPELLNLGAVAETEVPRIYLASPLTNLQREERISLLSQVENVKSRIDRMTVGDRADGEGWPVSVYAPIEHTAPWQADGLSAADVYQRNLTELLDSDALIVIAARAASAGVGQEIEWAARAPMPILYLSSGNSISRQIAGIPAAITVQTYGDDYSLLGKKVGFFSRLSAMRSAMGLAGERRSGCGSPSSPNSSSRPGHARPTGPKWRRTAD
jgi:hypothetical protein